MRTTYELWTAEFNRGTVAALTLPVWLSFARRHSRYRLIWKGNAIARGQVGSVCL